ncbi:MAG: glycerophosphodiester phosphodiesterase family protein [Propioniciclava sp.]|uniref:glycerophosphodiester phosphodiesterase family protein n=1 Tax=Propioniciclava sp. TaxID=2038686 RepID=UPI0039E3B730
MFGDTVHGETNALLNSLGHTHRPLIVSHAGVSVGPIPSNTAMAVRAALQSGADAVKIDVSSSADGVFFAFHDGFEAEYLGVDRNIQSLSAAEIGELSYVWKDRPGRRQPVERLGGLLSQFKGRPVVFALDRSWWRWPALLRMLDGLHMTDQLLLKVPAWETAALERLRQHKTKYPVLAICSTLDEVGRLPLHEDAINLVGVELITHDEDHPWFDREVIVRLHRDRLLTWVNSETLTTGIPLFAGYDDERAVNESPAAAWSRILDLGVYAVQTELPWLLWYVREGRNGTL